MRTSFTIKAVTVLVVSSLLILSPAEGQVWPWKWNQDNKEGYRQGRWREFYSHKPEQLMYKGRYKRGQAKGRWKTYTETGKLERLEFFEPKKKRIRTIFYYPNGKIEKTGMAYLFEEKNLLKYQWHGDWQYYDSTGTWLGWKTFTRGKPSSEHPIKPKEEGQE
ncbi:toxin-antitoxin system YwqK family antitoxin [Rufibacter quisquiliarum]|uniref:Antitoxin component YwqK of YwqJK toxin-antitoxin module n=1 Tax=Rufibacter quisquiliarum TaxID=1549639 RepID=A0A839GSW4_9BACT|nr:hypothetical protein [Rufibacter quisquiliarum]MBA9077508.1 antitoxin component YwqK of YwqJK toxin-antitoxin module [Rufibacter quisquiliarum]